MVTSLLLLLACKGGVAPADTEATAGEAAPALLGAADLRVGAFTLALDDEAGGGASLRALLHAAEAPGEPTRCVDLSPDVRLAWRPGPGSDERWAPLDQSLVLRCEAAPPTLVWALSPRLLRGDAADAARAGVLAASRSLLDAGGRVGLLLMGPTPTLVHPPEADGDALSRALDALSTPASGDQGELDALLAAAVEALEGAAAPHLALLLEDADLLAHQAPDTTGLPLVHVLTREGLDTAEALAEAAGGRALLAARPVDVTAGVVALGRVAEEALTLTLSTPTRPRACPVLHGALGIEAEGASSEHPWSAEAPCPEDLPSGLEDRFFIDPIDLGEGDDPLVTPPLRYAFGPRVLNRGDYDLHPGVDYEVDEGERVVAVAPGTVLRAGVDLENYDDSGIFIVVDHGGGLYTWYLHLQEVAVTPGDEVARGALLGLSGSTETTVPHLHFSISLCADCDPGDLPRYSEATLNPAWLLPRADATAHTISALSAAGDTVEFTLTLPADEADLQALRLRTASGDHLMHLDERRGLSDDDEIVDGLSAVPAAGPNQRPFSYAVTFRGVDTSGLLEVSVSDLAGHTVTATP